MELGQDVALISFCMCGLNAVDIFNAEKEQYVNGIFHYERRKTKNTRADKGYFEVRVPAFLKPTFEKYLSKNVDSPWLFDFHDRLSTSDSFCANVNTGIKQIWEKVSPNYKAIRGSRAPIMAVGVAPSSWTETVMSTSESTVGTNPSHTA